ncbi:MAG: DUF3343 domain-containing protein [Lachnospiraceae bacterium]|nr:DUF3343 domain-containing protein [Lachnospiraceae bacterium]
MAMEDWCKEHGVGGRIIPVPPTIMAGCGLAWCIEPEMEEEMIQAIRKSQISYQAMQEAMI